MASQDTFFKVKTGLGVGTDTLYASVADQRVSIGKTTGTYTLDVDGDVRTENNIIVDNRVGVGTTAPLQRIDVRGTQIVSQSVGIGTTNPAQQLHVFGTSNSEHVVVTGFGSFGVNTLTPVQKFQVGSGASDFTVITGVGSIGVGTANPIESFHVFGKDSGTNIVISKEANLGVNVLNPQFDVDIDGILSVVGFATITRSTTGIATVGFGSIAQSITGIGTVGFASISQSITGIGTVGFASISQSITGIATIATEFVGISSINQLFVSGITTTALLDVGIGGTLATFKNIGVTTVVSNNNELLKTIQPIVGIGSITPTRTLDVNGDVRVRGEIIDSNNNVGYGYSVLGSQALGISGRFIDASNLILRNKDFITAEAVGFVTTTYGTFPSSTILNKFKSDVNSVLDAISFDISRGGNSSSVGVGLTLYDYITNTVPALAPAIVAGISTGAFFARYVVNNAPLPVSYQSIGSSITQLIDLEVAPDGESNTNPDGCANVVSAIYSCVGIVTTIIDGGPGAAPNLNYPAGKLTWQSPGPKIGNEWFVNKLGDDRNSGTGPGDAFLTIKKACSVAEPGDTVRIYAGLYIENGPIQVPERVAVVGEDLRRVLVSTLDQTDLYHVRRGCYIAGQSFVGQSNPNAMVSFPTMGNGYADGTEANWQSPYVQNCTNFVPDSIGMRVDGKRAGGFKSMVLDAYTQYNQGGIGVSITNNGYAQLVSLFTICCDIGVYCDTGGVCDLNNSNSSFGNFGLVSDGVTPLQYTGTVVESPNTENVDSLIINVGIGASQAFIDAVELLRANKEFIAREAVGFLTSTSGPYGANGPNFDYGGSTVGKSKCIRDGQIIVESICSDILTLGNGNSINAGLAYRDSLNGSLTYLNETSPPPTGFSTGYVKNGEIAVIDYIAGISSYVAGNTTLPQSYQSGIGSVAQVKDLSKTYSDNVKPFILNRAGIITSIIGIGTTASPALELPKGQRPYDGQVAVIDSQYYFVNRIVIDNPGSGYDPNVPVEVTIDLPTNIDYFVPAEAAIFEDDINSDGTINNVTLLVSGTGYLSTAPNVTIASPPGAGTTATAHAEIEKYYFNPVSSTPVSVGGTTTVTFDQFITYPISAGATVYFYQSSKIIASSITFEYIGTGTTITQAVPSKGAVPITDNQVVATNGGKVPFTSTDQGGNFRISEGITINQNTGTISGQSFSKSLQAEVTPLIIALQQ